MPIKTVYRLKQEVAAVPTEVICNVCGKSESCDPHWPMGFHIWRPQGGYGDQCPGDMDTFEIVVCDDCMKAWIDTFKHPDVLMATMYHLPINARDCDDLTPVIVEGGWIRLAGTPYPEGLTAGSEYPAEEYPAGGVWRHFKGNLYRVLDLAQHIDTKEHYVVYQGLYGTSEVWVRPVSQWFDPIDRETYQGPRFTPVPEIT